MIVYLSGPMSGIKSFNIPAFDAAARSLRDEGHEVVSPAELDEPKFRLACLKSDGSTIPPGDSWGTLLARDIALLADDGVEAVVVLPGWEESRGAKLETYCAKLLNLPILMFPEMIPIPPAILTYVHGGGFYG